MELHTANGNQPAVTSQTQPVTPPTQSLLDLQPTPTTASETASELVASLAVADPAPIATTEVKY